MQNAHHRKVTPFVQTCGAPASLRILLTASWTDSLMRNMTGSYGSRGHPRGHPYEQALGRAFVPSRSNALVGSNPSASAFRRLSDPNLHALAILDNQTNVADLNSALLNARLRGARFVPEASQLSANVDLSPEVGQPGGRNVTALSQPQVPDDADKQSSMVQLGGHRETLNLLTQLQSKPEDAEALDLLLNLGTTKGRRQGQLQLDLKEIGNEDSETMTRLSQKREGSSNVAGQGRGDAAWQEDMNLLIKEHEKVVRQMKNELRESQMQNKIAVDEYETERKTCVRFYNELKATKQVKVVALKTLGEFVLTMKAQQATLKSTKYLIKEKRFEDAHGELEAQESLLQMHMVAMEDTGAAMAKAIQQILALQKEQEVKLQEAVDKLTDYNAESEQADQQTSEVLLDLAVTVLTKLAKVDTKTSFQGVNSTLARPAALFSARLENFVNIVKDSGNAALYEVQTAQDDLVKIKSSGPEHLVHTTMGPPSKETTQRPPSKKTTQRPPSKKTTQRPPSKKTTQRPPRHTPHDTVNVECNSSALENGGMEEQLRWKRKYVLVSLARENETGRPSSSQSPSQRSRLPRKRARPARHVEGDQEVRRVFSTGECTLGC